MKLNAKSLPVLAGLGGLIVWFLTGCRLYFDVQVIEPVYFHVMTRPCVTGGLLFQLGAAAAAVGGFVLWRLDGARRSGSAGR